jgi:hypothetical protein
MAKFDICRDYGLVARVHLGAQAGERLTVRAIEALPITQMHKTPRRMTAEESAKRVQVLNHLADRFGATGVRFATQPDGSGLACFAGAEHLTGSIGARCAAKPAVAPPTPELAVKIEAACSRRVVRIVENDDGEAEPTFATVGDERPALPFSPW